MLQYNFLYLFSVVESAIRYSEPPPPPPNSTTFSVAPIHGDDDTDMGGLKPLNKQKLDLSTTTDNGRSDLLAAIRASGGARGAGLKKAEERQVSSETSSEAAQLSSSPSIGGGGGLDLMGEISRKLAMRRKGMSGKADQDGNINNKNVVSNRNVPKPSAGGAMDKISSMIPPPPPTTSNEANNNDDDSDDDDW